MTGPSRATYYFWDVGSKPSQILAGYCTGPVVQSFLAPRHKEGSISSFPLSHLRVAFGGTREPSGLTVGSSQQALREEASHPFPDWSRSKSRTSGPGDVMRTQAKLLPGTSV